MKIEIGKDFPQYFKPAYLEEFDLFSHFEVTAGIPTVLFAVTTWKENGKPNVCFHSWSCLLRPGKRTGNRMCAFIRGAVFTEIRLLSLP